MGVSLERVQFKFASIIGELCNEPDVLSQFAVWLDLRLAEYKLKGNISLDCSGEEPDPIWLKGLNKIKLRKSSPGQIPGTSPSHSRKKSAHLPSHQISDIPIPQTSDNLDRDSPEIVVVVKDEPSEVYPVGMPYSATNSPSADPRKRGASLDDSSYPSDQWSKTIKQRRLSPPVESPSNQSLMSVLSGYQGDTQESDTNVDNSSIPTTSSTVSARNTDSLIDTSGQFSDNSFNTSQTTLQDIGWVGQPGTSTDTGNGNGIADMKYYCLVCGQSFTLKHNLKRHMKKHDPIRNKTTIACDLCAAKFTRGDNYKFHMAKQHGINVRSVKTGNIPPDS